MGEGDRIRETSEGQKSKATTKPRENRIASFSISMPKQQAVIIQPGAGVFYANVAKVSDTLKDAAEVVNNIVVSNCGDTVKTDLQRYAGVSDAHKELLKHTIKIINKSY